MSFRLFCAVCLVGWSVSPAAAQQRPLVTEDPETIGAGRVLLEGGFDAVHDQHYPVSGLEGNLIRIPTIGVSVGLSSIAEFQIDGGFHNRLSITNRNLAAPLASLVTATGDVTSDVEDVVIATKIRVLGETSSRPALGLRFATKLPNATNESGLGLDTTDFYVSILAGKTIRSTRIVGNAGLGVLGNPLVGTVQSDAFRGGFSIAQAITKTVEIAGEVGGQSVWFATVPPPGAEPLGEVRAAVRYTRGRMRVDGGVLFGFTERSPAFGVMAGVTLVAQALKGP